MTSGGWRLAVGAAILSACVVAPATAHADASCQSWSVTELPVPEGTTLHNLAGGDASGEWLVGNGRTRAGDAGVLWHKGVPTSLYLGRHEVDLTDVNSKGVFVATVRESAFRGDVTENYERLEPRPDQFYARASHINSAGDVVGLSGGQYIRAVVVWPGGSRSPIVLPGTDNGNHWTAVGIDDDRRVIAVESGLAGYLFDRAGNRVRLEPLPGHDSTRPQALRNGRVVGFSAVSGESDKKLVEWGADGRVVRTFNWGEDAADVNAAGDVLGSTRFGPAVWRSEEQVEELPTLVPALLTDAGEVFGVQHGGWNWVPVSARCA